MNFYPFHIGDYASHTRHLSLIEDLAYRRLIDAYYLNEKPITGSYELIARNIGMREYMSEIEYILLTFFEWKEEKGWINKRCDDEIAKYHAKAESARRANRIKTEQKSTLKSELKSDAVQNVTNNQEPITKNHIKTITPEGVSDDLWKEFLAYRKRHKAPVTDRITKRLITEAEKANKPLSEILELIMFKGWRSFDSAWVIQAEKKAKELPLATNEQIEYAYQHECGKDPKLARFNSYFEMKDFIIKQREKGAQRV